VCFLTDYPWIWHHRDGRENGTGKRHSEGDVLKYFDKNDTSATGEIALNITLHLTSKFKY
jgi:hypothetical protein